MSGTCGVDARDLLPRVDKDKGVVGADSEHDVDGEEELEREPLDLQHHRREEDGGAEGKELLGEGGKGDQERAGVQPVAGGGRRTVTVYMEGVGKRGIVSEVRYAGEFLGGIGTRR